MSINKITYLSSIYPHGILFFNNPKVTRFYFSDYLDVKLFLNSLKIDKTYVISFDFIVNWLSYDEYSPVITLSKPILITKNSNPRLISKESDPKLIANFIHSKDIEASIIFDLKLN